MLLLSLAKGGILMKFSHNNNFDEFLVNIDDSHKIIISGDNAQFHNRFHCSIESIRQVHQSMENTEVKIDDSNIPYISKNEVQFHDSFNLSKEDIKQIFEFMKNYDNAKQCGASNCKNKFVPKRSTRKYCSDTCRIRSYLQRKSNLNAK